MPATEAPFATVVEGRGFWILLLLELHRGLYKVAPTKVVSSTKSFLGGLSS